MAIYTTASWTHVYLAIYNIFWYSGTVNHIVAT
jgi:hypothetical protein